MNSRISLTTITILLVLMTQFSNAQWVDAHNHDGKCSHAHYGERGLIFNPDYDWQSPHIFKYDVKCYILDLHISDTSTYVEGNAIIIAQALTDIDTFAFELIPEQHIQHILINGKEQAEYLRNDDNVLVPLELPIIAGSELTARIYYGGKPPEGGFFSGVTNSYSPGWQKDVTWTLSEPFSAKDWFPVKQDLNDKADSAFLFFTTSANNLVGSQGLLTNVVPLPDEKVRYEWKTYYPIDYYLLSFAVADYMDYSIYAHPEQMEGDSLLIQNFIYNDPANLEMKREPISKTIDIMELFCDLFNLYPFANEKYGHAETQLGGGMEHQTMSTMGNFSFHLIAHELGHMWFGDHVTCATWSDIWINEGFATYSDYLANEFLLGDSAATAFITKAQNHAMSEDHGAIYIPEIYVFPGNEWRIFNGRLSYDKGASIIHMLRHEIGNDEVFFEILKSFLDEYGGGTATGDDFKEVAEEVAEMNFQTFFDQWYFGQGFPKYDIVYWQDETQKLYISSTQTGSNVSSDFFEMLLDFRVIFADGTDTIVSFIQQETLDIFEVTCSKNVMSIEVDPNNWTLEEVTSISSVGEKETNPAYFSIGPNPVVDNMNIYFLKESDNKKEIQIISGKGEVVVSKTIKGSNHVLDVSDLPAGMYFVVSTTGNSTSWAKFVKLK